MRNRTEGFTLTELLISIILGLVLLSGVLQVFINSKAEDKVQASIGRLQENARLADDYLSRYIRLADLWGGAGRGSVAVLRPAILPATKAGSNCKDDWLLDPASGLVGYQGDDGKGADLDYPGNGFPTGCLDNYLPGSDVIVLRFADPDTYLSTANLAGPTARLANGPFFVRAKVGTRAELFDINTPNLATAIDRIQGDVDAGVFNYQYQTIVFYLQTGNFGEGPTPTLAMLHVQGNGLQSDPLVDGVEMLKFEYGIDSDGDLSVDRYLPAAAISDWTQVLSVRVSMIVRGDALDRYADTHSFQMTKAYQYTPAHYAAGMGARYPRRLVVKDILLRNRVRG